jgi:TP53 regulating kinase-like protein
MPDAKREGPIVKTGAESIVRRARHLGIEAVVKERRPKRYRHPGLETRLRNERMLQEARALPLARGAGVRVPAVLDVDLGAGSLVLEYVPGPTAKQLIERGPGPAGKARTARLAALCREIGAMAGRLHAAGIIHGDLTTSNVIVSARGPVLVDFGLSHRSADPEAQGSDLILLEHAFRGLHPDDEYLLAHVWRGYRSAFPGAGEALRRAGAIRSRRRYA